jgi:hypothetical protein
MCSKSDLFALGVERPADCLQPGRVSRQLVWMHDIMERLRKFVRRLSSHSASRKQSTQVFSVDANRPMHSLSKVEPIVRNTSPRKHTYGHQGRSVATRRVTPLSSLEELNLFGGDDFADDGLEDGECGGELQGGAEHFVGFGEEGFVFAEEGDERLVGFYFFA